MLKYKVIPKFYVGLLCKRYALKCWLVDLLFYGPVSLLRSCWVFFFQTRPHFSLNPFTRYSFDHITNSYTKVRQTSFSGFVGDTMTVKVKDACRWPYLSTDRNHLRADTTRPLGEHFRQVSKKIVPRRRCDNEKKFTDGRTKKSLRTDVWTPDGPVGRANKSFSYQDTPPLRSILVCISNLDNKTSIFFFPTWKIFGTNTFCTLIKGRNSVESK